MKDDIGENPVHFLDRDLIDHPARSRRELPPMIRDRIKGIDRLEVLGAWQAAERQLQRGEDIQNLPDEVDPDDIDFYEHDIEPGRRPVLDALDERQQYLQTHGERPQETAGYFSEDCPERFEPASRPERETDVKWVRRDRQGEVVERRPWSERPTGVSTGRAFESSSRASEVATDGGERE
jgi:hypothetical protein